MNAELRSEADFVVAAATEWLRSRYESFDEALSVGVLGSHARGDLCAVSDIDYYVVFHTGKLASRGEPGELAEAILGLTRHVSSLPSQYGLAERFSVFWTTLECLQHARHSVGRWGAYDREVLRQHGRHVAGQRLPEEVPPRVDHETLVADSAAFLLDVLRAKLRGASIFERLGDMGGRELQRLGPVVLVKAVLMPVRLLYLLSPEARSTPIVNTSSAVRACRRAYGEESWWRLVMTAEAWRHLPPRDAAAWDAAALEVRAHLRALYRRCLGEYVDALRSHPDARVAAELAAWRDEIGASGTCSPG